MKFHVYLRPFPKSLSQTSRRRALGDSEIPEAVALLPRLMIRLRLKPEQLTEKEFNKIHCGSFRCWLADPRNATHCASSGIPDLAVAKNGAIARSSKAVQCFGRAMAEMHSNRRAFTSGMASLLLCPAFLAPVRAQQLERSNLKLGVANKAHLYYLPVTIAMSDFEGGGQAFDALLAGSVDIAAGAYEHTLRAQAMGQDVRAVIELGRFPGVVLAIGKDRSFKSFADLKGLKIGVTAPNSSSQLLVLYLMAKAGLMPSDASCVGVGGGERAVEAMKMGEIDAISNLDPVITRLQRDGAIRIVVDSRLPRVNYGIFGGTNPAAVLYARQEFIAANPAAIQALVNAFYKTLRWIATATTDEIVDTVPVEYFLGDRAIYVKALKANLLVYSRTGIISRQGMNSALKMMATFDPDFLDKKIDLQRTFDDRFIKRAAVLFDDPTNSDLELDERRPEVDLSSFRD